MSKGGCAKWRPKDIQSLLGGQPRGVEVVISLDMSPRQGEPHHKEYDDIIKAPACGRGLYLPGYEPRRLIEIISEPLLQFCSYSTSAAEDAGGNNPLGYQEILNSLVGGGTVPSH